MQRGVDCPLLRARYNNMALGVDATRGAFSRLVCFWGDFVLNRSFADY